ncbi:hypothetical protein AALB53_22500 [Lachnospiraceae bacterium 47-T17]
MYEQNGREVYFLGQYNNSSQWNGLCILNVYNGDSLETILEGVYDNGSLFSYRRASCESKGEWLITDRVCHTGYNSGETWVYTKSSDFKKEFTADDVTDVQILGVTELLKAKNEVLLSYYNGNTSGGFYNDDTGEAILVKYFPPNTVASSAEVPVIRTLYKGCFKDGDFHDDSEDAWYITRGVDTGYMYFRGVFIEGNAKRQETDDEVFENNLSKEQIANYLKRYGLSEYLEQFIIK